MSKQLVRVQVYLEPENLNIIDRIAKEERLTRSKVIRDAIEKHAKRLVKKTPKIKWKQKSALMEMGGIEVSKTGTVGLNIDEIYLED